MLSDLHDELRTARETGSALAAVNVYNAEIALGVVRAAESHRRPIFLQTNIGNLKAVGIAPFSSFLKELAAEAGVPVAVHLDHGGSVEDVAVALRHGFTSVMFDGSRLPFEENIRQTREVVKLAKSVGATVEGELGAITGDEDRLGTTAAAVDAALFTDPDQAERFARETGVDILAVVVGNVHGAYSGEPRLAFSLLEEISRRTEIPLALHGASGLNETDLRRAARCGVVKANFNTDIRRSYVEALSAWLVADAGRLDLAQCRDQLVSAVTDEVGRRVGWLAS